MEKSLVGDPIQWPGLVYSPLNSTGLIFAMGAVSVSLGLIFEEFDENGRTAVCRRKTRTGWERLRVAFAIESSSYLDSQDDIDLLICWLDDASDAITIPRLAISRLLASRNKDAGPAAQKAGGLDSILPEGAAQDLLERGRSHESYEETVKLLDEQIKKLQNG